MAQKLTDHNPNIADLRDQNRPTKISERFSELYNNEWSDAFECIQEKTLKDDREIIKMLLKLVTVRMLAGFPNYRH